MTGLRLCGSCKAEVVWIRTTFGNRMPIDPKPDVNGNMVKVARGKYRILSNAAAEKERELGTTLWMSHFHSCPNAEHHRQRRNSGQMSLL